MQNNPPYEKSHREDLLFYEAPPKDAVVLFCEKTFLLRKVSYDKKYAVYRRAKELQRIAELPHMPLLTVLFGF